MRKILSLTFLALTLGLSAFAETVDLGAHGKLKLEVPEGWSSDTQLNVAGANIEVRPKGDANAACKLTIIFMEEGATDVPFEQMKKRFEASLAPLVAGAVEKTAEMKKLELKSGDGVYVVLTDASLVGKPSEPGNYKVMGSGMIKLSKGFVIAASLFCDDKDGKEFSDLVKMLESLTLDTTL